MVLTKEQEAFIFLTNKTHLLLTPKSWDSIRGLSYKSYKFDTRMYTHIHFTMCGHLCGVFEEDYLCCSCNNKSYLCSICGQRDDL